MSDIKYEIVIIDDEIEILRLIDKFLSKTGKFKVTTYSNPKLGLEHIQNHHCDIVLLDIMMPQMDGIETLEKIMEIKPKQKVCMMTAYSTLDRVLKSHKEGATYYIMKPFDSLSVLQNKIEEILKK
ncbi:MAG: response regulator [Halarcobacter sp.]